MQVFKGFAKINPSVNIIFHTCLKPWETADKAKEIFKGVIPEKTEQQ